MDKQTVTAYDDASAKFAQDWREQPAPNDMYALLLEHFKQGPTADIGCGSGRDVAWLAANGFDAVGYDASEGLLSEARASYPLLRFDIATLPQLKELGDATFENGHG